MKTVAEIIAKKSQKERITMLTAYDYPIASFLDEAGIDIILVGDSLANVVLGLESTTEVGMKEMLHHTKAVVRAVKNALVIGDMPFDSYQLNPRAAVDNAKVMQDSGCFSIVLECIPQEVAQLITGQLKIPTICIGAGPHCDGQVLVIHDLLGLFSRYQPKFSKKYADLGPQILQAVKQYKKEVTSGQFPDDAHSFHLDQDEIKKL